MLHFTLMVSLEGELLDMGSATSSYVNFSTDYVNSLSAKFYNLLLFRIVDNMAPTTSYTSLHILADCSQSLSHTSSL